MAATANTTMQLAVPDGLRGRVMSVYTTIFAGLDPDRRADDGRPRLGLRGRGLAGHRRRPGGRRRHRGVRLDPPPRPRSRARSEPGPNRRSDRGAAVVRSEPRSRTARDRADPGVARSAAYVRGRQPSTAPNTSAALSPPNPNDVDRTRRYVPSRPVAQQAGQQRRHVRIRLDQVDRGRRPAVADGQRADRRLDGARRPERVAVERLRAADRHGRGAVPERQRDRPRLGDVADRRRRGVRVDVVDLAGLDPGVVSAIVAARAASVPSARGWTM